MYEIVTLCSLVEFIDYSVISLNNIFIYHSGVKFRHEITSCGLFIPLYDNYNLLPMYNFLHSFIANYFLFLAGNQREGKNQSSL